MFWRMFGAVIACFFMLNIGVAKNNDASSKNIDSADAKCFSLFSKAGARPNTQECKAAALNATVGMATYYCMSAETGYIDRYCGDVNNNDSEDEDECGKKVEEMKQVLENELKGQEKTLIYKFLQSAIDIVENDCKNGNDKKFQVIWYGKVVKEFVIRYIDRLRYRDRYYSIYCPHPSIAPSYIYRHICDQRINEYFIWEGLIRSLILHGCGEDENWSVLAEEIVTYIARYYKLTREESVKLILNARTDRIREICIDYRRNKKLPISG